MQHISKIVYINMDSRTDRRELMEQELQRVGWKAQRFSASSYKGCPNSGCLLSHATVLEQAYDEGCENVLVLEDDFKFIDDANKVNNSINAFFNSKIEWDVVMLTTCAAVKAELPLVKAELPLVKAELPLVKAELPLVKAELPLVKAEPLVSKIVSSGNGAAYLVNRSMMLELAMLFKANLENLYQTKRHWEYQNDMLWKQLMPMSNWYMFNEYLGYQREGYSDLSQDFKIAIIPHREPMHSEPENRALSPSIHFEIEEPELKNKVLLERSDNFQTSYTHDTIVNTVIDSFIKRSNFGYQKYGTTLDRDDLLILDWIQHAQEEHMDAILYLEKLKTYYKK
jgi:GR25 family glycosyltransferase involved in LPS biosynthesis